MADFQSWTHQNLVQLASDLQFQNAQLQADLKTVREAWKALVIKVEEQSQEDLFHDKTINPTSNR